MELAKDLADTDKPRAWSRHTPGTSAYKQHEASEEKADKSKSGHAKEVRCRSVVASVSDFASFILLHQGHCTKGIAPTGRK